MARTGRGAVTAGAWAVFLVLAAAYAASRLSGDASPNTHEATVQRWQCTLSTSAAATLPQTENVDAEDAATASNGTPREPTLAIPTELPRRDRGFVIEVPVEAELAPAVADR